MCVRSIRSRPERSHRDFPLIRLGRNPQAAAGTAGAGQPFRPSSVGVSGEHEPAAAIAPSGGFSVGECGKPPVSFAGRR